MTRDVFAIVKFVLVSRQLCRKLSKCLRSDCCGEAAGGVMRSIRPDVDDRSSTAAQGVRLAITEVLAETFCNAVHVALSPKELTARRRRLLSHRPSTKAKVSVNTKRREVVNLSHMHHVEA